MITGYFINPDATPLAKIDFVALKKLGIMDVYIRATNGGSTVYSNLKAYYSKIVNAGLKPYAWVWEGFTHAAEVTAMGYHMVMDLETYKMADYINEVKKLRQDTKGKTLIICTKPDGWDGDQKWNLLAPLCDYIMPMCYLGDYGKSITQLGDYMKTYNLKYPGKIYPVLETYQSDKNVVVKTNVELQAEINTITPYVKGFGLFRYGISDFKGIVQPIIPVVPVVPTGERCVDTINIKIPQKQFFEMDGGYQAHKNSPKIHLNQSTKKGDYVSNAYYVKNMLPRWIAYYKSHNNIRATAIWTVHAPTLEQPVVPTSQPISKPALILSVEKVLGGIINSMTDFYRLVQKAGKYSHYNCIQKSIINAIKQMLSPGNNCADWADIGLEMLKAMIAWGKHYFYSIAHVMCRKSSGAVNYEAGHFFLFIKGEEFNSTVNYDLAEAASGARGIGSTMCTYGWSLIGSKLC